VDSPTRGAAADDALTSAAALASRACAYLRFGRHADAVRDFDASLQGEPNVAFTWFARAALGDSPGAAADLARAREMDADVDAIAARHHSRRPEVA
jgi:hypothetical protein